MRRALAVAPVAAALAVAALPAAADVGPTEHVQVLAINDLHGALEPPSGSGGRMAGEDAGGAAYLAAHLRRLRRGHDRTVTVGAGDLIGATPLVSSLFHDEPTVAALDAMDVRLSAMGNHELDEGADELLRLQRGGCHPVDGCADGDGFAGAAMRWLAANTLRGRDTLLPPYRIETLGGLRVGFIGLTLEQTPSVVAPGGTAGLRFTDEASTANRYARELDRRGVDAVFVLLHQGGGQDVEDPDPNGCERFGGAVTDVVERLSDRVDAVASAHTHNAYVCRVGGKVVASASSSGRVVTDWDLTFDRRTHRLRDVQARNVVVTRDVAPDPEVQGIVDRYRALAAPVADRVVGHREAGVSRTATSDAVAAAELAATRAQGAQAALMNPGGVRAGIPAGDVTFGDVFDVLPFGYDVVVRTYTGAQLRRAFAQQADEPGEDVTLGTAGLAAAPGGVTLDGRPVGDDEPVRVALNAFLAAGGDGFTALRAGTDEARGPRDVDALAAAVGD